MFLRNAILAFACMLIIFSLHAQSKEQHLKLSERQKKWGWIVSGTIPALIVAGFVVKEQETTGYYTPINVSDRSQWFIMAGISTVCSGILFYSSARNKKQAISLNFERRRLQSVYSAITKQNYITELQLSIPIDFH